MKKGNEFSVSALRQRHDERFIAHVRSARRNDPRAFPGIRLPEDKMPLDVAVMQARIDALTNALESIRHVVELDVNWAGGGFDAGQALLDIQYLVKTALDADKS